MKRIVLIILILVFVLNIVTPAYCYGPIRKLGRGFWNVLTFYAEVPNRMNKVSKDNGGMEGITSGFLEGCCMGLLRMMVGFYEGVTFILPIPEKYEPVLKDPEFFFLKVPDDKK